jgi:hypothetical protein
MTICKKIGCKTRATFNSIGSKSAKFCGKCKKEDMVDVVSKRCIFEGCQTIPGYNHPGEKTAIFCSVHKSEDMVDVIHKRCIFEGCQTLPSCNLPGEKLAIFCSVHKTDNMVDVVSKRCIFEGCQKQPSCNFPGEKLAIFCAAHKSEDMVNVLNKRCIFEGCQTRPTYNLPGEKTGLFCAAHKTEAMVNVKDKKCIFEGCQTLPIYNLPGEKTGLFCAAHKTEAMVNVKDKKCIFEGCQTLPSNKQYEGYCLFCFIHLFPDKPTVRNYKTKESAVVQFVTERFADMTWVRDKRVSDGCSRRRPDLYADLGYQVIIVEVDENQHDGYDSLCENKRYMEISQDFGFRPIIFLRFNPDEYFKNNIKYPSCWSINKLGLCVVSKSKRQQWEDRLHRLESEITFWHHSENKTDKTLQIVPLFFDE